MSEMIAPVAPEEHRVEEGAFMGDVEMSHPAFGVLAVSRWTSNKGVRLTGSHLGHKTGLTITLSGAKITRRNGVDHHQAQEIIAEFTMSEAHWARFVSSVGNGGGVPATINLRQKGGLQRVPPIAAPEMSQSERHGAEIKGDLVAALAGFNEQISKLGEMIDSGRLGKKDLRELHHQLAVQARNLPLNAKCVMDTFVHASEQVVEQARIEFEAHVSDTAHRLGMEAIRQMAPQLQSDASSGASHVIDNEAHRR